MDSGEYPRNLLLEQGEAFLIHNDCNGEIEPIPEHGFHCLECNRVVQDSEVIEDPNPTWRAGMDRERRLYYRALNQNLHCSISKLDVLTRYFRRKPLA